MNDYDVIVIGTGRAAGRQSALDFGAQEFVDLDNDALENVGGVHLIFDVLGGDIAKRSAGVIRAEGEFICRTRLRRPPSASVNSRLTRMSAATLSLTDFDAV